MDVFSKTIEVKSRNESLNIYWLSDLHYGAANFDKERLVRLVRIIKNDKNAKIVILGGDLIDAIVLRDIKRFTVDTLDDDTLTGSPKQIRKNLSNIAVTQANKVAKILEPIKEFVICAVRGNHEMSVEKSSGVAIHSMICDALGVRDSGDLGIVCINLFRQKQSKLFRIAYMHTASGGRTAGASANSLSRAMNIMDAEIVFQGHNHSPAVQRIVSMGASNPGSKQQPKIVRRDRVGVNNGAFTKSYAEGTNSYDQSALYNPKDEVFRRVNVKLVEEQSSDAGSMVPRLSVVVEEIHM